MKKLLTFFLLLVVIIFAVLFSINFKNTEERITKDNDFHSGFLGYLGTTEEKFQTGFDNFRKFAAEHEELSSDKFVNSLVEKRRVIHFYNNLMGLMMDLKAEKLDEIILPELVGKYLLKNNNSFQPATSTGILFSGVSFGFRADNIELQKEINAALSEMKDDGTLQKFAEIYITNTDSREPEPIRPLKIENAPEIKIAVTGDIPPIDMFAGDGEPTGYNTAVLSELGRRLNKNIKFINTDAGGRSAALMSGRADVVFWYRSTQINVKGDDTLDKIFKDNPEGVILSLPYYSWQNEIIIIKNDNQNLFGIFSSEK